MKHLVLLLLFWIPSLFAAGPVTHVILAERYFLYETSFRAERSEFLRGSLFPDIRYMAAIPREQTHEQGVSLASIKTQTPFIAGEKFHAYVDEERIRFVAQVGILRYVTLHFHIPRPYGDTFLKLVEDEILYHGLNTLSINPTLLQLSSEEQASSIPFATVIKYHFFLSTYFSVPPHTTLEHVVIMKRGFYNVPYEMIVIWKDRLVTVAQDPRVRQYVMNLLNHFDAAFQADSQKK